MSDHDIRHATPRPWSGNRWRVVGWNTARDIRVICDTAWNKQTRTEEARANQALIVRAVNNHERLLEACKLAKAVLEPLKWRGSDEAMAVSVLTAAIAAATPTPTPAQETMR